MPRFPLLFAAALLGLWLALVPPVSAQGRPDCTEVLHAYHRMSGRDGARIPDPERIASKLGVDSEYVERCASAYGRSVKREKTPVPQEGKDPDVQNEKREEEEFEEIGQEERGDGATKAQGEIDDDKDRNKLRRWEPDTEEWEPDLTHEWQPDTGREWKPFLLDDDLD